jgi:hypothetical protein
VTQKNHTQRPNANLAEQHVFEPGARFGRFANRVKALKRLVKIREPAGQVSGLSGLEKKNPPR